MHGIINILPLDMVIATKSSVRFNTSILYTELIAKKTEEVGDSKTM
jgi:hypothetical protein